MPPRKCARGLAGWGRARAATARLSYRRRQPYGKKASRSRALGNRYRNRPSVGRPVVAPLIHRRLNSEVLEQIPLVGGDVRAFTVLCPDVSWGAYTRGMDIGQTASSSIRSRNVTFNLRILPPAATTNKTPFEFRVIQGFVKIPLFNIIEPSAVGQGAYDGICTNFAPDTAWKLHIREQLNSAIGNVRGASFMNGNIATELIRVISDRKHVIESTSVSDSLTPDDPPPANLPTYNFPTLDRNYTWRTNTRMRLYPTSDEDADDWDDKTLCPLNNAKLEIPFMQVMLCNNSLYTTNAECPFTQGTWTHYWVDQ